LLGVPSAARLAQVAEPLCPLRCAAARCSSETSIETGDGGKQRRQAWGRNRTVARSVQHFCAGELDILKIDKTPLISSVSYFKSEVLGAMFEGATPTKAPRGDGTGGK